MSIPGSLIPLFSTGSSAAAGYQIERSLRFNSSDSAYLSRTPAVAGSRTTWTWAGWVKRSTISDSVPVHIFSAGTSGASNVDFFGIETDNTIRFGSYNGSAFVFQYITTQVFRDPSAWYHLVLAVDTTIANPSSDRVKFYVNGVRVTTFSTATDPGLSAQCAHFNTTSTHYLGKFIDIARYFPGYLADIYFIDGQALTPSSFTEVSATTGQLVPIVYTGTFGTNGFWLKFSDNSAATAATLGNDYSGNNNDWTPNNLSVLSSYTDTFLSRKPDGTSWANPTNAFDGTTANYADGTYNNGTISTIRFNKPLTGVTLLEYFYDGTSTYGYNSTDVATGPNLTGGSYVTVYSGSATTINNVRCTSQAGNGVIRLYAIRVNGTILNGWTETDPPGNDSLVDTPTSYGTDTSGVGGEVRGNYATLNPLDNGGLTLANGNLDFSRATASWVSSRSTFGVSSGKWYWEVTLSTGNDCMAGISKNDAALSSYFANVANGWAYNAQNGQKYNNGSGSAYGNSWVGGNDTVGVAFDADAGSIYFYKNGVVQNSGNAAFTGLTSGPYFPSVALYGTSTAFINFGQRAFAYQTPGTNRPAATFLALCDTNIAEGTITTSGTFTGNANADGPFVYLNGVPTAMTINSNSITFGTHADKLSNGFKVRNSTSTYNIAGINTVSVSTTGAKFKFSRAQPNP